MSVPYSLLDFIKVVVCVFSPNVLSLRPPLLEMYFLYYVCICIP